jgi:hypothetical protein
MFEDVQWPFCYLEVSSAPSYVPVFILPPLLSIFYPFVLLPLGVFA